MLVIIGVIVLAIAAFSSERVKEPETGIETRIDAVTEDFSEAEPAPEPEPPAEPT